MDTADNRKFILVETDGTVKEAWEDDKGTRDLPDLLALITDDSSKVEKVQLGLFEGRVLKGADRTPSNQNKKFGSVFGPLLLGNTDERGKWSGLSPKERTTALKGLSVR